MKKDIRKDKLKVFGKTLLSLLIVAGGVAVTVIFPNPITVGVLGGVATLIARNNGILGKTKKIREKSKERKKNKEEAENMELNKAIVGGHLVWKLSSIKNKPNNRQLLRPITQTQNNFKNC